MYNLEVSRSDDIARLSREVAAECLGSRLRMLARSVSAIYQEMLTPLGLTVAQFNILTALILAERMSPAALSSRLRLEKSTISRNLRLMASNGWVQLQGAGRSLQLTPSAQGRLLYKKAHPSWRKAQQHTSKLLGADGTRAVEVLMTALNGH